MGWCALGFWPKIGYATPMERPRKFPYRSPKGNPQILRISAPAADAFAEARELLDDQIHGSPSASVALEFLVWWFEQTYVQKRTDAQRIEFYPVTRKGPGQGYQFWRRPVTPATIRKLAGVSLPTKRR